MPKHELPEGWTLTTPDNYVPVPLINRDGWIEALESGRYSQGRGSLCYDGKYCCLGVLCDITPGVDKQDDHGGVRFGGNICSLPRRPEWTAAFRDGYASLPKGCMISDHYHTLSSANDSGASFNVIAAAIRILYENQD